MSAPEKVVIALGSNLGDRKDLIHRAIAEIGKDVEITQISSLIETDPVGGPEQGPYLNGVLIGQTRLGPEELMQRLLGIEAELGRVRSVPNAPRTIDLDLIDYAGRQLELEGLILPHPRAHQRHFVLAPWFEIEPEGVLVGHGTVRELLQKI